MNLTNDTHKKGDDVFSRHKFDMSEYDKQQ